MTISYNWLKEYLPRTVDPETLSKILTSIGLEVESMEWKEVVKGGLKGLVTGYVTSCIPHPNSDHLHVTRVQIKEDGTLLPIVCGAANVAQGQKVIVATVGTLLYDKEGNSFTIKKAKLRGEPSEGMICAEDEIGMGNSHAGIMVLPPDTPIGMPAAQYFKLPDPEIIYEIGLTPNRSDANAHLGVAKDVCAYLSYHEKEKITAKFPDLQPLKPMDESKQLPLSIKVADESLCPRYTGVIVTDLKIQPSPEWLQNRLRSIGLHPINNLVDITNFVLWEYGQPLHAFDYDKIKGHQILVKTLTKGTKFKTLDDKEIELSEEDLMICNANSEPMCMGGVYGGIDSGITDLTTTVFIESAYFDPRTIRRSSVRHDLRTDAALHFEKGVEMKNLIPALTRAATLMQELAGGKIASPIFDLYPNPLTDRKIEVSYAYLTKICGKEYAPQPVHDLLSALGFKVEKQDGNGLTLLVPAENLDFHQPADIAEEVLRIDGLDNVPIPTRINYTLNKSDENQEYRRLKERICEFLAHAGLNEIITNSITSGKYYPEDSGIVRLMNNLSSELDIMRPDMLYSGLEVLSYNLNRKMSDIHIFEIGKTYQRTGATSFSQREWLSIWSTGNFQAQDWQQKAVPTDIFLLKGIVSKIFQLSGLGKSQEVVNGQTFEWRRGKQLFGTLKSVGEKDKKTFGIKPNVYYACLDLRNLYEAVRNNAIQYHEVGKYPSINRDLALILPKSVPYEQIEGIARQQKIKELQEFSLFDIFEHEKIGKDNKSMALSFTFGREDRTLTDKEVDEMMQTLIGAFEKKLNATIRS